MISKEIDKIVIVVKVGQTENSAFEHTINALKNIILNSVDLDKKKVLAY